MGGDRFSGVIRPFKGGSGKSFGKSKSKGKEKSKGKGKGKFKRSAPLDSDFWVHKENDENRQVLTGPARPGSILRYKASQGWGFIVPDEPEKLPKKVKASLAESAAAAEEAGKTVTDPNALYFRKPDVNHEEGFRLAEGTACTFQVYIDDKGAGACDVSPA